MIRTALLIDADNVKVELVAEVLAILGREPRLLQHRRAYGSVQKAVEFAELARDHAIRFLPSTFAGPNSTDLALAIDAVELLLRQPMDEVVLVSSDTDFAPLVVRLRELGARVIGFGQQGKSASDVGRDYLRVYDEFTVLGAVAKPREPVKARRREPAAAPAEPVAPMPVAAPARKPTAKAAAKRSARLKAPPPKPPLPEAVQQVLDACPELRGGAPVRLNGVAKALHDLGVLKKNAKTTALFKKQGAHFELLPDSDKPESVRFLGSA
ncbi:NYN domain-containing protein [Rivibacter subsaxonicus]|uniref:NYN domain-containing protein n=1 Tax=Rivibacter subsaxonicus TaxID=457575 RepID=A0A4V2FSN3_9BURK|nr:NYN domain-containing protein [Rivibacter subsaxonicus]RZT94915.1 NYN domain-containing protein [Rivibacter subsaxonicus]